MVNETDPRKIRINREQDVFRGAALSVSIGPHTGNQPVHSHEYLEVEVIGGGTGYHVTAQGRQPARAGDIYILRPGTWHGYEDCDELLIANTSMAPSALRGDSVLLQVMPELRDLLWRRPTTAGHRGIYTTHIAENVAAETIQHIAALKRHLGEQPGNRPLLVGRLLTILGTLVQHLADDNTPRELHPAVAAVFARLDAAPEHNWHLDELAEAVNLNPAYLVRLFREHLGLPPITYLAHIRAERAAWRLAHTSQPISHIGAFVGWSDPAYFTRRFRSIYGLTPTEYRNRASSRGGQVRPPRSLAPPATTRADEPA